MDNSEEREITCGVLCTKCGKESGLIRVTDYGGRRVCRKCGKRLWHTGYYKARTYMTEEELQAYEKRNENKNI